MGKNNYKGIPAFAGMTIIVLLSACTPKNSFKIQGSVQQTDLDGKVVFLSEGNGFEESIIDSATITNGKFSFKGTIDSSAVYYLFIDSSEDEEFSSEIAEGVPVLVQTGLTTVDIVGEKVHIGGNSDNTAYQDLQNRQYDIMARMQEIADSYYEDKESGKLLESRVDELYQELGKVFYDYLHTNINTLMGEEFFRSHYDYLVNYLSYSQMDTLLSNASESFRSEDDIQSILLAIAAEEKIGVGQPFSDFSLPDNKGKQTSLSDIVAKNNYVLICFWASWNDFSSDEIAYLKSAYAKYHPKKFEIVGVSVDDNAKDWKANIAKKGLKWIQLFDTESNYIAAQTYQVREIPHTILIGRDGKILAKSMDSDELKAKLEEIFEKTY
ncbi:MAG: AhpC/TSA family protein [Dysgonamonadaceae bacterium]|jgi:peroxiredoxin|nr:AhpC/TSA family protein [Dysgonamonadaceae bacterium]